MRNSIQITGIAVLIQLSTMALSAQVVTPCDTVTSYNCKSIVTDTVFNPYVMGVLGNYRANKAYTYYAKRTESDPNIATNIRKDGTFKDFKALWSFQQSALKMNADSSRWVWNSEIINFNNRGTELENRDPLGRYNCGLYGYLSNLPVAIVQNSRYRESAYDGFEDYNFATFGCPNDCPPNRHIDFSAYASSIVSTEKHTGKSSLKVMAGEQAGVNFEVLPVSTDTVDANIIFSMKQNSCAGTVLEKIKADKRILIPNFKPVAGSKMVVSAWVKEEQDCKCVNYVNNHIAVIVKGPAGETLLSTVVNPSGSIIDGWQRIEGVFSIPANASSVSVSMRSIGSSNLYFDDFRLHPYNANMKSFVFHPVNMRLMAEMDENNYATFYEYDDEGTLVRVKKETVRGIKTIKESRSALVKQ